MSYLARLHLGGPRPARLLGSLYGNFVRGRLQGQWPDEIEWAIQLHRHIDVSIDSRLLVHAAKRRLPLECRRLADVLLSVFFDHCLTHNWNGYANEPLPQLVERVYSTLRTASPLLERLARIAPRMVTQDWLGNYCEFTVLREVLGGISRRLSRPHLLDGSWEELAQRYDDLNADFHIFYPQPQVFALDQRWAWRNGHWPGRWDRLLIVSVRSIRLTHINRQRSRRSFNGADVQHSTNGGRR